MKKLLTYVVVVATIAWSLGLAAVVPVASAAYTPTAGDKVKVAGSSAVYYIDSDLKKHLFSTQSTFESWYGLVSSSSTYWSSQAIKTVTQSELDALSNGANVNVRPGTLIKFSDSSAVYAVSTGGKLYTVKNGDAATALFGSTWGTKVLKVVNSFRAGYYDNGNAVGELTTASKLPDGFLIKYAGSDDTVYYLSDGKKSPLTDDAYVANKVKDNWVFTAPSSVTYDNGSSITGVDAALTTPAGSGSTGGGTVPAGSLTVSLASDTPGTTTLLENQARAPLLALNLTNTGSVDVTVDSFVVERGGLASDSDFSSVAAILDSATGDQLGLNKTFNSDHRATFSDDFVVKAGTTKKLVIAGNMPSDLSSYASDAPKMGLYSMTLKNGTVGGSLPVWGNPMMLNYSVVIATATVAAGGSNPTADAAPKVGDTNVDLTEVKVTNDSSTEELEISKMVFKQAGTVADSDIASYKLVKSSDGTTLATASQVDKYISFNFTSPLTLGKSKNESFMVKAVEISGGSGRTIQLDIYRNTDVMVKGKTYGAYVIPTFPASSQPYFDMTVDQTIGNGSVKIEPSPTFVAANIAENKTGVQIAEWLVTVKGEPVNITQIAARIATSTGSTANYTDITNAIFFNKDTGAALTGAVDAGINGSGSEGVTSTDTVSLPVGEHKIGLKVDLSGDFASDNTIQGEITAGNLTITGDVTGNAITATPATPQASSVMTIKTASIAVSVSPNPPATTVAKPATGFEAARIVLDASASGDDVKITQLKTAIQTTTMEPNQLTSLKIYDGTTELTLTSTPDPTSSTGGASVTTTWSFSPAVTVTKGTVKTLSIKTNISSATAANDKFRIGLTAGQTASTLVTAKDTSGNDASVTYTAAHGQLMTIAGTGTLTLTRSDSNSDSYLNGNTTGVTIGKVKATAVYETVKIEKMYLNFAAYQSGGTDEIANSAVYLYDGSTLVGTATITSSNAQAVLFDMTSAPVSVVPGTEKELSIKIDTGIVANDGTATNSSGTQGFTPSLSSTQVTAKGMSGSDATVQTATLTFPSYALVKSQPKVSFVTITNAIGNGVKELAKVKVAADSKGPIGLYKLSFQVTTTTVTVSNTSWEVYEDGTLIATTAADGIVSTMESTNAYHVLDAKFNLGGTLGGRLREITAGGEKTYTLKGNISGYTTTNGGQVSVSLMGDDTSSSAYKTANAVDNLDDDDFIWSDLSYGNTSTTATTTTEWLNGYSLDSSAGFLGTTSSAQAI